MQVLGFRRFHPIDYETQLPALAGKAQGCKGGQGWGLPDESLGLHVVAGEAADIRRGNAARVVELATVNHYTPATHSNVLYPTGDHVRIHLSKVQLSALHKFPRDTSTAFPHTIQAKLDIFPVGEHPANPYFERDFFSKRGCLPLGRLTTDNWQKYRTSKQYLYLDDCYKFD